MMKIVRNLFCTVLLAVVVFSMMACSKPAEEPAEKQEAAPAVEKAPAAEEAENAPVAEDSVIADEPEAGKPIRIGAILSVTGKASWLGAPEKNVAVMMVEEINAAGGANGRPIELIVKDDQGNPDNAVNAIQELLREDVVAVIGPSLSGPSMLIKDICEQEELPLVSCAALAQITEGMHWVFKTPHKDSHVVQRIYEFMRDNGMNKVALITSEDGFGAGGRQKLQEDAPSYGIEVVGDETYTGEDTDMTAQLTKIRAANPQAIINWSISPGQTIVMKNMRDLGMSNVQLFQSHGFGNYGYLEGAGDAAEGVIFPAGRLLVVDDLPDDHPQKAVLKALKDKYEARYNDPISTFAGHAYDALMLVVQAIDNGASTRAEIRDYIESLQGFVGTGGIFNFSPEDHTGLEPDSLEMLTVKDGRFTTLAKVRAQQ